MVCFQLIESHFSRNIKISNKLNKILSTNFVHFYQGQANKNLNHVKWKLIFDFINLHSI